MHKLNWGVNAGVFSSSWGLFCEKQFKKKMKCIIVLRKNGFCNKRWNPVTQIRTEHLITLSPSAKIFIQRNFMKVPILLNRFLWSAAK